MESSSKKSSVSVDFDNLAVPEINIKGRKDVDCEESEEEDINYQCAIPEIRTKKRNQSTADKK